MGFWKDLLGVVNSTLSAGLKLLHIPASPNTLYDYENAIFGSDPNKTLKKALKNHIGSTSFKDLVKIGTQVVADGIGIPLDVDMISNTVDNIHSQASIKMKKNAGRVEPIIPIPHPPQPRPKLMRKKLSKEAQALHNSLQRLNARKRFSNI